MCKATDEEKCWVVRLCRRNNEDRWYFVDTHGNVNARLSSAEKYEKSVATQYADAISRQHPEYLAVARRLYSDGKLWHKPEAKAQLPTKDTEKPTEEQRPIVQPS